MTEKKVDLFTFMNQLQSKKRTHEYDKKIAPAFMLTQWLSHDKGLIGKVNKINQYQFLLPDKIIYEYYMDVIPTGKRYIKWIKKRKADVMLAKRIKKIQDNNPKLSTREAKMIITFLMNKK